jgi:hypothetical protein
MLRLSVVPRTAGTCEIVAAARAPQRNVLRYFTELTP